MRKSQSPDGAEVDEFLSPLGERLAFRNNVVIDFRVVVCISSDIFENFLTLLALCGSFYLLDVVKLDLGQESSVSVVLNRFLI